MIITAEWHESYPHPTTCAQENDWDKDFQKDSMRSGALMDRLYNRVERQVRRELRGELDEHAKPGACVLYLIPSLLQAAKEADDKRIALSGEEWAELTHESTAADVQSGRVEDWRYEFVTGIGDSMQKRRVLGSCALKIIRSGLFSKPRRLIEFGEVATVQTGRQ